MKKELLFTTALLCGLASPSFATEAKKAEPAPRYIHQTLDSDVEVTVSGYMIWAAVATHQKENVFVSHQNDNARTGVKLSGNDDNALYSDAYLDIMGRYKVNDDTTLEVFTSIQTVRNNINIDDSHIAADTRYGRFMIGNTANVTKAFSVRAPSYSVMGFNDSDLFGFVAIPNDFSVATASYSLLDGKTAKLTYYTPKINGFQLGLDIMPSDSGQKPNNGFYTDKTVRFDHAGDVVLKYTGEFGRYDFQASIDYSYARPNFRITEQDRINRFPEKKIHQYSAGAKIGSGNWEFGGTLHFINTTHNISTKYKDLGTNVSKGMNWTAGYGYKFGPYKASLSVLQSRSQNTVKLYARDIFTMYQFALVYAPYKGIEFFGETGFIRAKSARKMEAGRSNESPFLVLGTQVNF